MRFGANIHPWCCHAKISLQCPLLQRVCCWQDIATEQSVSVCACACRGVGVHMQLGSQWYELNQHILCPQLVWEGNNRPPKTSPWMMTWAEMRVLLMERFAKRKKKRSGRNIECQLCARGRGMSSHLYQSCLAALAVGSASCRCERMEGGGKENRRGHAIPARSKWFETGEEAHILLCVGSDMESRSVRRV